MLEGNNLTYIRHERNQGIGKDSKQPFDFANIILSDGLESFKIDMKPELDNDQFVSSLKKGDKVNVVVDVYENFNRTAFRVISVKMAVAQKVG